MSRMAKKAKTKLKKFSLYDIDNLNINPPGKIIRSRKLSSEDEWILMVLGFIKKMEKRKLNRIQRIKLNNLRFRYDKIYNVV